MTTLNSETVKPDERDSISTSNEAQDIIEAEAKKEGRVEPTVYKNYAAFSGWFITVLTCLSAILMQASRNGNDLWLSFWVDTAGSSQSKYSTTYYLVILCIFCLVNSLFTLVRAFSFSFGGLQAAIKVHDQLLHNLLDSPVSYFDRTPCGRILNRFSSYLYTVDVSLPFILNILLSNFVGLLGIAIVLSIVQVSFLLLLIPFWFLYKKLQVQSKNRAAEASREEDYVCRGLTAERAVAVSCLPRRICDTRRRKIHETRAYAQCIQSQGVHKEFFLPRIKNPQL